MLSAAGSTPCPAPKPQPPAGAGAWPELRCGASPACKVRAPVFKEEEGDGKDYNLYGTEHCLQVSLFNEKQNNPSGTQSTIL